MARTHVVTERIVTPATFDEATGGMMTPEVVSFETRQVPFSPQEEAAADAAAAAAAVVYPAHVKAEAQRRIIVLTGATSLESCIVKQLNANMRANELNNKRVSGETLTQQEEDEAQALRDLALAIKLIRAKSNDLEAMSPIPADYAANIYWS